jgi:hypothetical protein
MAIERRTLLKAGTLTALSCFLPGCSRRESQSKLRAAAPERPADYTIRIAAGLASSRPTASSRPRCSTTSSLDRCCGSRKAGRFRSISTTTDAAEQLHWHGQTVPIDVDGRRGRHAVHSGARASTDHRARRSAL